MPLLSVHADSRPAGLLSRMGPHGSTFRYNSDSSPTQAVSLTMPIQLASYDEPYGLHPIFDMNLPEGRLRDYLIRLFRKAAGTFDDIDLLGIVGRSQIGRIRYSESGYEFDEGVPYQSVEEILRARRGGALLEHLLETFAQYSGISGVQPKVLIRGVEDPLRAEGAIAIPGSTHIVKLWDPQEYPELAANEYFCLRAAARAGLPVPPTQLSESGDALIIDRFDLRPDGGYYGVEDFCCMNGITADKKYRGGYESTLFRRASQFMPAREAEVTEQIFRIITLNAALRNGDAHLKNFAVMYDDPSEEPVMTPVYDVITTTAYLPNDQMALTIEGQPHWPNATRLIKLANQRTAMPPAAIKACLEQTADAMSDTAHDMAAYAANQPSFKKVHQCMRASWELGIKQSLAGTLRQYQSPPRMAPA